MRGVFKHFPLDSCIIREKSVPLQHIRLRGHRASDAYDISIRSAVVGKQPTFFLSETLNQEIFGSQFVSFRKKSYLCIAYIVILFRCILLFPQSLSLMAPPKDSKDIESQFRKRTKAVGVGHITGRLLLAVNRDADGNPSSPIYRQYGHMMSCNSRLLQSDGKVRGVYHCKCRGCVQCNRTRTAVLINEYKPRLDEEKDNLYFITLTRRNVRGEDLQTEIQRYVNIFRDLTNTQYFRKRVSPDKERARIQKKIDSAKEKIRFWSERMINDNGEFISNKLRNFKVRHFEEKKRQAEAELAEWSDRSPLIGLRKLECTYHADKYLTVKDRKGNVVKIVKDPDGNPVPDPWYDTYHPHFHLVCNSAEVAEWFKTEWLARNAGYAEEQSQDVQKCEGDGTLKELFKYFSKMTTKTINGYRIDPRSLDTIFTAMNGFRVFQRFGTTEAWRREDVDLENVEETAIEVEDQDNDTYIFVDEGKWGEGEWAYVSYETGRVLASVPKKGRFCDMLRDVEREVGVDKAFVKKAEKVRKEVYFEPKRLHFGPIPDMKEHLKRQRAKRKESPPDS